jgi:effector-binding domain-containing protein
MIEGGTMDYQVSVMQVASQLTAVVRFQASIDQLAQRIPQACGEVWEFVRSTPLVQPGRNLALYLDDTMNIECGVEVFHPFVGNDRVVCSRTPAGWVATTAHFGPYNRLKEAHDAVRKWCTDHGHTLAGPSWEVYGHWTDDPAQLRTDVFWLLQATRALAG